MKLDSNGNSLQVMDCTLHLCSKDFKQQDQFTIDAMRSSNYEQSNGVMHTSEKTVSNIQIDQSDIRQHNQVLDSKKNVLIKVGQLVLAKQKYSVPWPSRIVAVKKDSVSVFFFGDGRHGSVKKCELYSICDSKDIVLNCLRRNITNYRKGILEMERILGVTENLSVTIFV